MADQYILDIKEKDSASQILAEYAQTTLDREFVEQIVPGKNGISCIRCPEQYYLMGYSSGGDYRIRNSEEYAESVMKGLLRISEEMRVIPLAMANVIDAHSTDEVFVRKVGKTLADIAKKNEVAWLNGEIAKLGTMMNCDCNISGTMLGLIRKDRLVGDNFEKVGNFGKIRYLVFDPQEELIWMNCDGVGTKSLCNARMGRYTESVEDLAAMQYDDLAKLGGTAIASFNLLETNGDLPVEMIESSASWFAQKNLKSHMILQHEEVGDRIIGPHGEKNIYNMSGTLVSILDEEVLRNQPRPKEGDYLIAIKGKGRSNGFTDRRNLLVEWFGKKWHETDGGRFFGNFVTEPSIVFYPTFKKLLEESLASSVTHMSGGAYRDKLSKILERNGLYAEIGFSEKYHGLYTPDVREAAFASHFKIKDAYTKFAMGNEGFVMTSEPEKVLASLRKDDLEARVVCKLEKSENRVGLKLKAFNGDRVDFSRDI